MKKYGMFVNITKDPATSVVAVDDNFRVCHSNNFIWRVNQTGDTGGVLKTLGRVKAMGFDYSTLRHFLFNGNVVLIETRLVWG